LQAVEAFDGGRGESVKVVHLLHSGTVKAEEFLVGVVAGGPSEVFEALKP
jgi:hypothetical protein